MENEEKNIYRLNLVVLGNSGVGKSSFINRLLGKEFTSNTKLDMWALGIILYQMVQGCHPFVEQNSKKNSSIIDDIINNNLEFNKKIKISDALKKFYAILSYHSEEALHSEEE